MEFDSDWSEEIVVETSVDDTRENGDFMMLKELYQQEEVLMVFERVQQLVETELSKLSEIQASGTKWNHNSVLEMSNDSNETVFSTITQDDENYENDLQLIEDPFVNSILEDEDVLVEDPLFIDCGTIDCDDDVKLLDESQMDCILIECFEKADLSLGAVEDMTIDEAEVENQLYEVQVCLERLPQSVIESITKVKVDSTNVKKTESTDHKKYVQRYCPKCEKFTLDDVKISRPKSCQDCGDSLLYSCTKCQMKFFQTYTGMANHRKVCKSKKVSGDVPKSTDFYVCRDCDFRTLHETLMVRHLGKTKHRLDDDDDGTEQVEAIEVKYTTQYERDYTKAFQRYCDKCKKCTSSTNTTDDKLCRICNTRLLYRCLECGRKSKSHKSLVYHLKYQCLPKTYGCSKCDFTTTNYKSMVGHLKRQHPAERIFCEHCDYETTRKFELLKHLAFQHDVGEGFVCRICNGYRTTDASRLEQHMLRKHSEKGERYKCAICRRYETNDQEDLWRHIDRRHREK